MDIEYMSRSTLSVPDEPHCLPTHQFYVLPRIHPLMFLIVVCDLGSLAIEAGLFSFPEHRSEGTSIRLTLKCPAAIGSFLIPKKLLHSVLDRAPLSPALRQTGRLSPGHQNFVSTASLRQRRVRPHGLFEVSWPESG